MHPRSPDRIKAFAEFVLMRIGRILQSEMDPHGKIRIVTENPGCGFIISVIGHFSTVLDLSTVSVDCLRTYYNGLSGNVKSNNTNFGLIKDILNQKTIENGESQYRLPFAKDFFSIKKTRCKP